MAEENNPTPMADSPDAKSKKNIFSMPLLNKQKGKEAMKKKNYQKGYIFMAIAVISLAAYSFYFLYPQVQAYLNFNENLSQKQGQIEDFEVKLSDLEKTRDLHKAAYDEQFKEEQGLIDMVFPDSVEKLEVIRLMENFATHLAATYPPFEFSSLSFQDPAEEKGYTVLPFQTTIKASRTNFDRFLALINLSGDIDPEAKDHIRLMEISQISLTYLGSDATGIDQGVNFNVSLKAYSK